MLKTRNTPMDMESGGASVFGRNPLASFHDNSPTSRVGFPGAALFLFFDIHIP